MDELLGMLLGEKVGVHGRLLEEVGMVMGVLQSRVGMTKLGRGIGAENDKGLGLSLEGSGEIGRNEAVELGIDLRSSVTVSSNSVQACFD